MTVASLASLTVLACCSGAFAINLDWPVMSTMPGGKHPTPFGGKITAWGNPVAPVGNTPAMEMSKIQQDMRGLQGRIARMKKLQVKEDEEHTKLLNKMESMQKEEEAKHEELVKEETSNSKLATSLGKHQSQLKPPDKLQTTLEHQRKIEAGLRDFRDHRLPLMQAEVRKFSTVKEHLKGNISQLEAELMAINQQLDPLQKGVWELELKRKPLVVEANHQRLINKKLQAHLDELKLTFRQVKHGEKLTVVQTESLQRHAEDDITAEDYEEKMNKLGDETLHSSATRQFLVKQQGDLKSTLAELRRNATKTQTEEHMLMEKVRGIMPQITQLYAENAQLDMENAKLHRNEILAKAESKLVGEAVRQAADDFTKSLESAEEGFMAELNKVEHAQL